MSSPGRESPPPLALPLTKGGKERQPSQEPAQNGKGVRHCVRHRYDVLGPIPDTFPFPDVFPFASAQAHDGKMSSLLLEAWFLLIVVALSKVNVPR